MTEFAADGARRAELDLGPGHDSYRAFRYPWQGLPADPPALVAKRRASTGKVTLYVSWNGATEVAHWRVSVGPRATDLRPVGVARRRGFETAIALRTAEGYAKVTAHDAAGRRLAASKAVRL